VVTHTRKREEEFYERVFWGNQKIKERKKKVIPTHALSTPIQHKKKPRPIIPKSSRQPTLNNTLTLS